VVAIGWGKIENASMKPIDQMLKKIEFGALVQQVKP
jgi:hypothetical protein